MLTLIELENFKAFGRNTRIPLAPITLIFGENSAGKSSILQALNLLKQTVSGSGLGAPLLFRSEDEISNLGSFKEVVFDHETRRDLRIGLECDHGGAAWQVSGRLLRGSWGGAMPTGLFKSSDRLGLTFIYNFSKGTREARLSGFELLSSLIEGEPLARFQTSEASEGRGRRSLRTPRKIGHEDAKDHSSRCVEVSKSGEFWEELYTVWKRCRPKICSLLEGLWEIGATKFMNCDESDFKKAMDFYQSSFSLSDFVERMALTGEEVEYPHLTSLRSLAGKRLIRDDAYSLPELAVFDRRLLRELAETHAVVHKSLIEHEERVSVLVDERQKRQEELGELHSKLESLQAEINQIEIVSDQASVDLAAVVEEVKTTGHPRPNDAERLIKIKRDAQLQQRHKVKMWESMRANKEIQLESIEKLDKELKQDEQKVGLSGQHVSAGLNSSEWEKLQGIIKELIDQLEYVSIPKLATEATELFSGELESFFPMGPFRQRPKRLYTYSGTRPGSVGHRGNRLPDLLFRSKSAVRNANEWLKKLDIGYRLEVERLGNDTDHFELRLLDTQRDREVSVSLSDVGFGVSQILPFIVQTLSAKGQIISIEQPEVHIHPRLQADLGDLLAEGISETYGHQFLIETHSEHLVLRMQRLVREKKILPEQVSVLYVSRGSGGSKVKRLRLEEDGSFKDEWPGGFFPERLRELF